MTTFDLEALSDCFDSDALAKEIRVQLNLGNEAAPLTEIAKALGIFNIRDEALSGIAGALVVPNGKFEGEILLNSNQIPTRKRFTLAHEIGHFVHPEHHPIIDGEFKCSEDDVFRDYKKDTALIERQANQFASELLIPNNVTQVIANAGHDLDFNEIISYAERMGASMAAVVRKLQPLCTVPTCFIFSENGKIKYLHSRGFPFLSVWCGDPLPEKTISAKPADNLTVLGVHKVSSEHWLKKPLRAELTEQVFVQENGYRITKLSVID